MRLQRVGHYWATFYLSMNNNISMLFVIYFFLLHIYVYFIHMLFTQKSLLKIARNTVLSEAHSILIVCLCLHIGTDSSTPYFWAVFVFSPCIFSLDLYYFVHCADDAMQLTAFENYSHCLILLTTERNYFISKSHDSGSLQLPVLDSCQIPDGHL